MIPCNTLTENSNRGVAIGAKSPTVNLRVAITPRSCILASLSVVTSTGRDHGQATLPTRRRAHARESLVRSPIRLSRHRRRADGRRCDQLSKTQRQEDHRLQGSAWWRLHGHWSRAVAQPQRDESAAVRENKSPGQRPRQPGNDEWFYRVIRDGATNGFEARPDRQ